MPKRVGLRHRVAMMAVGSVMAVGLAVGTAAPAQAAVGLWDVYSSWFQAVAGLTSTGGGGTFQAHAYLGNTHSWGVKSQYNTKAEVNGYSQTHNAILYRNGSTWAKAQG
ncbi:MAG: hypothetical protein U1E32_07905 [Rhodoglobus sp.]|uniref:hypothetical protein n=1 Tax=unclassified Microbacterium TaxID=2609290 RepID=UPI00106BFEC0|nr:hypothetical protein [Microbacterium sp. 3H14]MDZ4045684.1 hypothetical protein [Rhodoglobus sp.]TFB16888.1 hypothetical protein E3V93_09780 [Microbacterium sp. 3H14]